ncbi:MAG TPA: phage tail protein [Chloroflexia bacterium]|nr:phage tail protein [Chloroflexia bacterium]
MATDTIVGTVPEIFQGGKFWVEIDGMLEASFLECSGMQVQTEVFEYKEGGLNSHSHKLPVRTTFSNITLKRGFTSSNKFWSWYKQTVEGQVARKDISIILYSTQEPGVQSRRWEVSKAYPVKWGGLQFNSKSGELLVESIELAYDSFKLVL